MFFRRWFVTLFIWFALLVGSVPPVHAQASPRSIPVTGEAIYTRLSPDGHTVAVFEDTVLHGDQVNPQYLPIRLIDITTGKETAALSDATDYASDVAFSPDGKTLASYHQNGFIYLWNTADGKLVKTIPALPGAGVRLRFLADGKSLVTPIGGTALLVWSTDSGNVTAVLARRYPTYAQYKAAVMPSMSGDLIVGFDASPDGKTLAVATLFGNVYLWDIAGGQLTPLRVAADTKPKYDVESLTFSRDGKFLVYYDLTSRSIHAWDVASQKEGATVAADSKTIALSPDGGTVAWATRQSNEFTVSFASLSKPGNPAQVTIPLGDQKAAQPSLAFTPDGKQIVLSGLWAQDTGKNAIYVVDVPQS
jgi:WD40 repeat protein